MIDTLKKLNQRLHYIIICVDFGSVGDKKM
jgi:hypothetical protein